MKIAITGHSSGIGLALAEQLSRRGHEIVGLSRRNGYNIRSLHKIVGPIAECDWFINNAQTGFAQTELLYAVYEQWQEQPNKFIMNISTMMTNSPVASMPGIGMNQYRVQKMALEEAHRQLYHEHENGPRMMLVRPGSVATNNGMTTENAADADEWAKTLLTIIDVCGNNFKVPEISLGPMKNES